MTINFQMTFGFEEEMIREYENSVYSYTMSFDDYMDMIISNVLDSYDIILNEDDVLEFKNYKDGSFDIYVNNYKIN